jgi:2-oxoglutarate dehydrogenase E1 component
MSPKSLLRAPEASSTLDEIANGSFQRVIPDQGKLDPKKVKRVLLCSGKVYYDLVARRAETKRDDVAVVRLEQIYPINEELVRALSVYEDGTDLVWVQEEPWNMGSWHHLALSLPRILGKRLPLREVTRAESASPATGSAAAHKLEQKMLLDEAFR